MRRFAARVGGLVHFVLVLTVALVVLAGAAGLALSWRLSQGPLEIDWAARRIEAAANLPDRPTRLSIGEAAVEWGGFAAGAGHGLALLLRDVRLVDLRAAPVARLDRLDMVVSLPWLLLGQVVPHAVSVSGLSLGIARDAAGGVAIDLGGLDLGDDAVAGPGQPGQPGPTVQDTLGELARPPRQPGQRPRRPDLKHVEELQSVAIRNSVFLLHDPALAGAARLEVLALDLRRPARGGVHGTAAATLALGTARTTLAAQAELAPGGGTEIRLQFAPFSAAAAQDAAPAYASTDRVEARLQGAGTVRLNDALRAPVGNAAAGGRQRAGAFGRCGDRLRQRRRHARRRVGPAGLVPSGAHRLGASGRAVVHAPGGAWPSTLTLAGSLRFGRRRGCRRGGGDARPPRLRRSRGAVAGAAGRSCAALAGAQRYRRHGARRRRAAELHGARTIFPARR